MDRGTRRDTGLTLFDVLQYDSGKGWASQLLELLVLVFFQT